jgi:hypothetical protein
MQKIEITTKIYQAPPINLVEFRGFVVFLLP